MKIYKGNIVTCDKNNNVFNYLVEDCGKIIYVGNRLPAEYSDSQLIDLGEKALTAVQRPIVTLIVERSETPVGFRSAGPNNRLIVVEGMGDMVLRSGKRIVCLKLRRSDADGLENTVYADTNEWDLQTSHASQVKFQDEEIENNSKENKKSSIKK